MRRPAVTGGRRRVRALGRAASDPQAADRGRPRIRPRRRLRAGDGLRPDRRGRRRAVRPAGDPDRGHAGRRWHAAPDACDRQGAGDGADPDRPVIDANEAERLGPGDAGRARGVDRRRGARPGRPDRDDAPAGRRGCQAGDQRGVRHVARPRAWPRSGRRSSTCSRRPTRRRGWRRSWRSDRPAGRAADGRDRPTRHSGTRSRTRWRRSRSTGPTRGTRSTPPSSASSWRRSAPRAGTAPSGRVILTGAGPAFCAGQDLRESSAPDAPPLSTVLRGTYNPLILAMRRARQADRGRRQRRRRGRGHGAGPRVRPADRGRHGLVRAGLRPGRARARQRHDLVPAAPGRTGARGRARADRRPAPGRRRGTLGPRQPGRPGRGARRRGTGASPRGWPPVRRARSR